MELALGLNQIGHPGPIVKNISSITVCGDVLTLSFLSFLDASKACEQTGWLFADPLTIQAVMSHNILSTRNSDPPIIYHYAFWMLLGDGHAA